ncbi:hypothetical protein KM043_010402 [Ampulex compressa]|nr:hypothetical protein KM043_010402 [Ampulex compressa]
MEEVHKCPEEASELLRDDPSSSRQQPENRVKCFDGRDPSARGPLSDAKSETRRREAADRSWRPSWSSRSI